MAAATGAILVAGAAPASAHAVLQGSDPPADAALDASPKAVTLTFSENVSVEDDAIRVIDTAGARVDDGHARSGESASQVVVGVDAGLASGTYVVSWRVVSADSHPISGAFAFGVGVTPDTSAVSAAAAANAGSSTVTFAAKVARFVAFAGVALLLGAVYFLVVLWPGGLRSRSARTVVWSGWGAAAVGSVALLFLQGLYTSGLGLSDLFGTAPLSATLGDRYGQLVLVRLVALLLAVPLLRSVFAGGGPDSKPKVARRPAVELAGLGAVVAVTLAAVGHASAGDDTWFATAVVTVHVAAMSVWLGGLVVLAFCLLRGVARQRAADTAEQPDNCEGEGEDEGEREQDQDADRWEFVPGRAVELARVLPRWSATAIAAVAAIVASGVLQTWREVGASGAFFGTEYGRLLLYKLWIFGVMLALGALGQRWVVRHYRPVVQALAAVDTAPGGPGGPGRPVRGRPRVSPGQVAALRRGVLFEVALGAAVLAVTAVLVNTVPARTSYSPPFAETVFAGPLTVDVEVDPTKTGPQTVHAYTYDPAGKVAPLEEASAQLSLPEAGIGPIAVPMVLAAPGHATAEGVQVPLPGQWQLRLTLRVSEFDQYVTTVFYEVR